MNLDEKIGDYMEDENIKTENETEDFEDNNKMSFDFSFLKTKTGPGSVEDYVENPLNFNNTKETAQILRGVSGFTDDLDLALIDIIIGIFKMFKGGKNEKQQ